MGFPFYLFSSIGLVSTIVFWGRNSSFLLKKASLFLCSTPMEWFFLIFIFPLLAWFYTRKEKRDHWQEYKRKTRFSNRLIKHLIKKKKPITPQLFAQKELSLDEIQIYLQLLSKKGILREIPRGQKENIYISSEIQIKKPPFKLNRYLRSSPPLYLTLTFFILTSYYLIYLFAHSRFGGIQYQSSTISRVAVEFFLGSNYLFTGAELIWALVAIILLLLIWRTEIFVLKKWKSLQDKNRQRKLIYLAKRNDGVVNSLAVSLALGIPLHKARDYLDFLQDRGFAKIDYDETGNSYHRIAI
jgi:hypothetical protein